MHDDNPHLTVLLVRHAEAVAPGTPGFDEFTRPLTEKGIRDAHQLCEMHASTHIDAAYSSPYLRARQTIEPIARARGIAIDTFDDLRERMLSPGELRIGVRISNTLGKTSTMRQPAEKARVSRRSE